MVVRTFEPRYVPPPPRRHRRGWLLGFAAFVALLVAGLGVLVALWSGATLSPDGSALAKVGLQPFAGALVRASAFGPDGTTIPVAIDGGRITPLEQLTPGEAISVDVVIRRPGWLSWLLGSFRDERLTLRAPLARVADRWLTVASGEQVAVSFEQPVTAVSFAAAGQPAVNLRLPAPTRTVILPGLGGAGSASVSAAVRSWEKQSAPVTVSWFPRSRSPVAVADPAPGSEVSPLTPIRLTFSVPVSTLLGGRPPAVDAAAHGSWRELDSHTLLFTPAGLGEPLGTQLRFTLAHAVALSAASGELSPASEELAWTVPVGSPLRLEQLLAQLGYLPLDWQPSGAAVARSARAQAAAAVAPPRGSFAWRYPNTPSQLQALWAPRRREQIVKGAVMAFEHTHGLGVDGIAGPLVWHALLTDAIAGRRTATPYSYVYVRVKEPQLLTLWSAGHTVLTSPGNTGIPSRPTAHGTFQVFEHIPVGTMRGTNPDGSHYNDPGIRWISYFNGGDAVHAFPRGSYGTPQSLGCVELPLAAAAKAWPYMPLGTLVTIE
ncbi:MAG TPA: L,D-transpeptidase [Solirubrobacteraceae bacterium]|nr:L,D-transpeptidase [Solirubrobacteraceae bacterium]